MFTITFMRRGEFFKVFDLKKGISFPVKKFGISKCKKAN